MKAVDLAPLYAGWEDFRAHRRRMDPRGLFSTPYIQELLGE